MYDEKAQYFTNMLFQSITSLDSNKVATKFVKVEPVEAIKNVTVPCFFIHCEHDKKVPIHAVERIYHNKPGFKRLWITQGKSHFGSYAHNPEMYWYKVNKFLTKLRTQDITKRKQTRVCDQRTVVSVSDDQRIPKFL
jgi:pimeloyl-ACP methyl ester carboxylesterase